MPSKLRIRRVTITPKLAAKLLSTQGQNRRISKRSIGRMADDMLAGNWAENGESIKIGSDGRLIDGQHRLAACVRANCGFPTLLVEGLSHSVAESIDQGQRRSSAHILQLLKPPATNATNCAAVASLLWQIEKMGQPNYGSNSAFPSRKQVIDTFTDNRAEIEAAIKAFTAVKLATGPIALSVSQGAWLYLALHRLNASKCVEFFDLLKSGEDRKIRVLLTRLHLRARYSARNRMAGLAMTIKCWNAWVTGEPFGVAKFGGREGFPDLEVGK